MAARESTNPESTKNSQTDSPPSQSTCSGEYTRMLASTPSTGSNRRPSVSVEELVANAW
jgi:hypothetical protein